MPGSVAEGKEMVKDFAIKNGVKTVLDGGPGEGTYYYTLQGADIEILDGIEVWGPYIEQYDLTSKYHEIYIADIYYFDWNKLTRYYDLIILGDIIEHLPQERGEDVIAHAVEYAKYVVVSLPIYGYHQVATTGNTYETHVEQYSDELIRAVLGRYEILESFKGGTVGVYIFKKKIDKGPVRRVKLGDRIGDRVGCRPCPD